MEPRRLTVVGTLMLTAQLAASTSFAQPAAATQKKPGAGAAIAWTAMGAGAGFGLGVWAGLSAFDDAINSDRKVWTTALLGAVGGGALGFVVARARAKPAANATTGRGTAAERDARLLHAAPMLGSGAYRGWLERPLLSTRYHGAVSVDEGTTAGRFEGDVDGRFTLRSRSLN